MWAKNNKPKHKFDFRNHAIEQYVSRKRLDMTASGARAFLNAEINRNAYKLEEKTRSGQDQWHVPGANCILITKYENGINVVVTIIKDQRLMSDKDFLAQEDENVNDSFMSSLMQLDTTAKYDTQQLENNQDFIIDQIKDLLKDNRTKVISKLSSRNKLHQTVIDDKVITFEYNNDSKRIKIVENNETTNNFNCPIGC